MSLTTEVRYPNLYARRGANVRGSAIDQTLSLLQNATRDVIPFAMGCPDDLLFPLEAMNQLAGEMFRAKGADVLNYGPTEGEKELREFLAARSKAYGVAVRPDQILITTGGMQGLDLVFKLFLNPGDQVVVEQPTYTNAIATIANYEGEFIPIPVDEDGMQVDRLAEVLAAGQAPRLKMIYVIPTFQNPAGVTLSLSRRRQLLELARQHKVLILEDDPYRELRFEGEDLPSLLALDDGQGTVLSVNTFAKILSPGVRVGWVIAPDRLIERMVAARQSMDTCTNQVGQRLVSRFCTSGGLDKHIAMLRREYGAKRDLMLQGLEHQFADVADVSWTRPGGGFFIWMTLPRRVDTRAMFDIGLEEGIAFIPGHAFDTPGSEALRHCLRLNFTFPATDRIPEGFARLRRAYERLTSEVVV